MLVPTRFLMMIGHFVLLMILSYTLVGFSQVLVSHYARFTYLDIVTQDTNIVASLPTIHDKVEEEWVTSQLELAVSLSFACFALEFLMFFGGFSLFLETFNAICTKSVSACV